LSIYWFIGEKCMKRTLVNFLGLLGIVSLLSYTAAVVFSPLAYPGYDWMRQVVSDLSAVAAPSRELWNQLSSLYGICGIVNTMMVCVFIEGKLSKNIRIGIYVFTVMNWISYLGYSLFPLSTSGFAGTFQDIMHVLVTLAVVSLSILSLALIMVGGYRHKQYKSLAVWAVVALVMMFAGAIGTGAVPQYLGVFERFSLFAVVGFNAVLGIYLFQGFRFGREQIFKK